MAHLLDVTKNSNKLTFKVKPHPGIYKGRHSCSSGIEHLSETLIQDALKGSRVVEKNENEYFKPPQDPGIVTFRGRGVCT